MACPQKGYETLISKIAELGLMSEQIQQEEEMCEGVPVCGANCSSPVVDQAYYIDEIRYRIGSRIYVENAD